MKGLAFGIAFLMITSLAAHAATPGYSSAERALANELQKRIVESKSALAKDATEFARVYLRRAYAVEVEGAEALAKELINGSGKGLQQRDQLQFFAWSLDALDRGAVLADVRATMKGILKEYAGPERAFMMQQCMSAGRRYTSPLPLVTLAKTLGNNGMVGSRRQEFISWIVEQSKLGEDPSYIVRMYDAICKVVPSVGNQTEYVKRFQNATRFGVPPRELTKVVEVLSKKYDSARQFDQEYDPIMKRFYAGMPFAQAAEEALRPPKPKAVPVE